MHNICDTVVTVTIYIKVRTLFFLHFLVFVLVIEKKDIQSSYERRPLNRTFFEDVLLFFRLCRS